MKTVHKSLALFVALPLMATASYAMASTANMQKILSQAPNLNPKVLQIGITAHENAIKAGFDKTDILTLVDFTKPSNEKRFYVIDLKNNKVLYDTYTTQGKYTGFLYATDFSNVPQSKKSSIGVYKTLKTYGGKHGTSIRLQGMDEGFNDNALQRDIVVHPAWYANPSFVKKYDRTGRSWGCFGVPQKISKGIMNTIKGNSLLVAYYPNKKWLNTSKWLKPNTPKVAKLSNTQPLQQDVANDIA